MQTKQKDRCLKKKFRNFERKLTLRYKLGALGLGEKVTSCHSNERKYVHCTRPETSKESTTLITNTRSYATLNCTRVSCSNAATHNKQDTYAVAQGSEVYTKIRAARTLIRREPIISIRKNSLTTFIVLNCVLNT